MSLYLKVTINRLNEFSESNIRRALCTNFVFMVWWIFAPVFELQARCCGLWRQKYIMMDVASGVPKGSVLNRFFLWSELKEYSRLWRVILPTPKLFKARAVGWVTYGASWERTRENWWTVAPWLPVPRLNDDVLVEYLQLHGYSCCYIKCLNSIESHPNMIGKFGSLKIGRLFYVSLT